MSAKERQKVVFSDNKIFKAKIFPDELLNNAWWRRISSDLGWGASHLRENLNYSFSVVNKKKKTADYVKMVNDLFLIEEGRHDNAAINNVSLTKYLLEQKTFDHPACCPDSSPIENLCRSIVSKVYEGGQVHWAISGIKITILDAGGKIPSVQLQKLVDCMPSWIFEFIKASSGSTKY